MPKAILVMDMPECCCDCSLTQCKENNMSTTTRPTGCPLRILPEIKSVKAMGEWLDFNCGWNACLDTIKGGGGGTNE